MNRVWCSKDLCKWGAVPWQAITAINGGVKNPKRISIQGNLAASFAQGIYRHAGLVIYHRGLVYYPETGVIRYRGKPL